MELRPLRDDEHSAWLDLRAQLWPEHARDELAREQAEIWSDLDRNAVLVVASVDGRLLGFVEVAIRAWAEGCSSRPVGYIEGWYVTPDQRRLGIGRKLIAAAERWARGRGCAEMASDAALENDISVRAHAAMGYREVGRAVLFRKPLPQ